MKSLIRITERGNAIQSETYPSLNDGYESGKVTEVVVDDDDEGPVMDMECIAHVEVLGTMQSESKIC